MFYVFLISILICDCMIRYEMVFYYRIYLTLFMNYNLLAIIFDTILSKYLVATFLYVILAINLFTCFIASQISYAHIKIL